MDPRTKVAALAIAAMTVAGCGSGGFRGVYDLPLPGGADLGDHPYRVTAQFTNVLNLVPQSAVRVNDVAVGRVTRITLPPGGWTANVTMLVNGGVRLPANAVARVEQSSLLGEKYVQLAAPPGGTATGSLTDGAVIPVSRTNRNPEVEEVLGALSLLLNGGGIGQLRTITRELNNALRGNEPQIRAALSRITTLVSDLDAHRKDITDALDGLNRLSATLAVRGPQIGRALDDLSPGLRTLDEQRGALVTMLRTLDRLSGVAVDTIDKSKDDLVADLKALEPTLRELSAAGSDLPQALQVLLTYPFTDAVLDAVKGDYLNVYLSITAAPGTTIIPPLVPDGGAPATTAAGGPGPGAAGRAGAEARAGTGGDARRAPLPLPSVDGTTVEPPSRPGSSGPAPPPPPSAPPSAGPPAQDGAAASSPGVPSGGGN